MAQLRGGAAALLVSMIGAGFSAHAGLLHMADTDGAQPVQVQLRGYEADDHFPGAALLQVEEDQDAALPAAAGTTGTIALPDLPLPADAVLTDGSVHAAAPFRMTGSATDRMRALQCLTTAIYYEAAREPDDGQRAVAQVILNRVRHRAFPNTVCGVVYQGSEKPVCQFSFACDGAMARAPNRQYWLRAGRVAAAALGGSVFAPAGMATHYHTYAVTPLWNRGLVMTGAFGAHFFHRWKGWWGTPAAFTQLYTGQEPLPAPHVRTAEIAAPAVAAPVLARAAAAAVASPAAAPAPAQPAYAESGAVQPRYAGQETPESTILDRWKDSGKPLR